jgi:hypothetical protein
LDFQGGLISLSFLLSNLLFDTILMNSNSTV